MFLAKGVCMLQGAEFRCGPIARKSAGARVPNKILFVRSQPRCMAGSVSWCCENQNQFVATEQHTRMLRTVCAKRVDA